MAYRHIGISVLLVLGLGMAGQAQNVAGVGPAGAGVLNAADRDLFKRAFEMGAKGDWAAALALGAQGQDATARQLLQWRYALDANSHASFAEINTALDAAKGWPARGTLLVRAEAALVPPSTFPLTPAMPVMTPAQTITWFGSREPSSSVGRIRLGEALIAAGENKARGASLIAQGWAQGSFDEATEAAILAQDSASLTQESQRARLDALLWRGEASAARRQMARLNGTVDAAQADLAAARLALAGPVGKAKAALDKVSGSDDPALLFDWSHALRVAGKDDEAHAMLLRAAPLSLARDHRARWWGEIHIQARDALRDHNTAMAMKLLEHAQLTPGGAEYPDQQFLAGFITLRFLKQPAASLPWFTRLTAAVTRPISKSRGEYWQGRALEAMDDKAPAYRHYRLAAAWPESFYGQLAIAHTEVAPTLRLPETPVEAAPASELDADALMPQMKVLADLGLSTELAMFAAADAAANPAPRHLKRFMQALTDWGYPHIAVRLAKEASYTGAAQPPFAYPQLSLPAYPGSGAAPDPAMVLALIRQETEFNPVAVSTAGAQGLMQVMPAAARTSAKAGNLPYKPASVLSDPAYNMQLGMVEIASHVATWNGSLIMAVASYNAGPGNVKKWVAANGDPRDGVTDPLDWVEQISFGETRNYVERVLENMEVYRGRLNRDAKLMIQEDLYAPAPVPRDVLAAPAPTAPVKKN